jgi:hypothetical protein
MNNKNIIKKLQSKQLQQKIMKHGVISLSLFWSYAKNTERNESDVDVLIDFDKKQEFSLFDLMSIKNILERNLWKPVDITTYKALHPLLKKEIFSTLIPIFWWVSQTEK